MGHSRVCRYRVIESFGRVAADNVYGADRLPKNLERHVMCGVVATMPGFVNEHIGKAIGIKIPARVRYIAQTGPRAGETVREWICPPFRVLPDPKDYPEVSRWERLRS